MVSFYSTWSGEIDGFRAVYAASARQGCLRRRRRSSPVYFQSERNVLPVSPAAQPRSLISVIPIIGAPLLMSDYLRPVRKKRIQVSRKTASERLNVKSVCPLRSVEPLILRNRMILSSGCVSAYLVPLLWSKTAPRCRECEHARSSGCLRC